MCQSAKFITSKICCNVSSETSWWYIPEKEFTNQTVGCLTRSGVSNRSSKKCNLPEKSNEFVVRINSVLLGDLRIPAYSLTFGNRVAVAQFAETREHPTTMFPVCSR